MKIRLLFEDTFTVQFWLLHDDILFTLYLTAVFVVVKFRSLYNAYEVSTFGPDFYFSYICYETAVITGMFPEVLLLLITVLSFSCTVSAGVCRKLRRLLRKPSKVRRLF